MVYLKWQVLRLIYTLSTILKNLITMEWVTIKDNKFIGLMTSSERWVSGCEKMDFFYLGGLRE